MISATSTLLSVFPYHVVQREIADGEFAIVNCELNYSGSPVGVSFRDEQALSPATNEFLSQVRVTASELSKEKSSIF